METLLLPAAGPWLKLREAIELVRALRPARAFPIHDIHQSPIGMENFDGWLAEEATAYSRLALGASVDLAPPV